MIKALWHSPVWTTSGSIAVQFLGVALLLPLALRNLSTEEASLWFLFSSVAAFLALLNFGFAPTFIRFVAYAQGHRKTDPGNTYATVSLSSADDPRVVIIHTMRYVNQRLGFGSLVFALSIGSLAVKLPITHISYAVEGWIAWFIIAIVSACVMYGNAYSSYLTGIEKIADFRRWEIAIGVSRIVLCCVVLLAGGGLLLLVVVNQVGMLLVVVVNRSIALNHSPALSWSAPAIPDAKLMSVVWPAAWRSGIGVLMSNGILLFTGIVYAQLAPVEAVASYLLALRIIQAIVSFANVPFYVRLPNLARLYASNSNEEVVAMGRSGMLLANWIYVLGVYILFFFGDLFLKLIGSEVPFVQHTTWGMLSLAIIAERVGAMHLQLYSITNHIVWHIANGVSGIIMLVAMPFSYARFGVIGFPISIFLGYVLFYLPYSMSLSYSYFGLVFRRYDLLVSVPPVLAVLLMLLISSTLLA